ncbi:MAG: N-acetylglucosamine-6-phosphate deacetylase [Defluviitaleaceae bacterium]|nr:N-acetylglucosamine-6-phosphate deacetylase [Defluviitaleaceae bacterium]
MREIFIKNIILREGRGETSSLTQDLYVRDGKISRVGRGLVSPANATIIDGTGKILLPAFIDIHTHGAVGVDVNTADTDGFNKMGRFFASQGVGGYLPAILSATKEQTLRAISTIAEASKFSDGARILGIHLEGPFLSPKYKGAMPENLLRKPCVKELEEYVKASNGAFLHMTVSPELPKMPEFIKHAVQMGVSVALGHSGADYQTAFECINAGANAYTHMFNATKLFHQQEPSVCGAALESDIYCEAICDGLHVHPGMLRLLLKIKGNDRFIAITDSIMATGLGDGNFKLGESDITVKNGDAMLSDLSCRAGSTLTMHKALKNLSLFTGKSLFEVSPLLSKNPAEFIGLGNRKGQIIEGMDADLIILNSNGEITNVIIEGREES